MTYKLITFKLSFRSIVRLLFLFMASNEGQNIKAQKGENLLVLFITNFLFIIYPGWAWHDMT